MRVKSIGPVVAMGLLWAFASAQGCGGDSKSSKGGSGASGGTGTNAGGAGGNSSGGSGGSSGSGRGGSSGSAGAQSKMCDTTTCEAVVVPLPGTPAIPPCCPAGTENTCGLDTSLLAAVGVMFDEACQPKDQPGTADPNCPSTDSVQVDGGLTVQFSGCCRPNGQCGYLADELTLIPGLPGLALGLGCVDSTPFLEGGAPETCGSGSGGTGGEAGAGSAGEPGAGGAGGDPGAAGMGGS